MNIPFTPQLLGDLIEKGYTYMLASVSTTDAGSAPIVLKPVRHQPVLTALPQGFETYYKITREPMQLACGVDGMEVLLDHDTILSDVTSEDVYDDSYFRMSEEFFRQVLDSLEDYAVFTTDKGGNVNSWNTGAQKVLGYTEPEILGETAEVFFTPEDRINGEPEAELTSAMTEGRAIDERYHVRKDGSRFWGSGLVFPLFDESGTQRGFTKIMRNLREQQEAQEAAQQNVI